MAYTSETAWPIWSSTLRAPAEQIGDEPQDDADDGGQHEDKAQNEHALDHPTMVQAGDVLRPLALQV
jgi:hypothetical protein